MPFYNDLSYLYPLYPIVGAIAIILCAIPIPAHWKASNVATVILGLWVLGLNIIVWIGTIVWHNNIDNPYPIWGDIVNFYYAMFPTALASTTLCIQYRLWTIARARNVFITKKDKRRQKYLTWALCLGFPFLIGLVHYVVQGHRYNVFEDLGPMIETYNVTLAYPLFFMWDPILCVITTVYSILTIRIFLAHRKELDAALASGSNVNKNRYIRFLWLAAINIILHLPLSLWVITLNSTAYTVYPWISWDDTHSDYGRIAYYNRFLIRNSPDEGMGISITLWIVWVCAICYFALWGFGEAAMKNYQACIGAILRPIGITYPQKKKHSKIKRTWLDVLLGRPGKPTNPLSSAPTSSMPQFNRKSSASRPPGKSNPTGSQTTTAGGDDDLHLDIANLNFLDPAEVRKQARISAYTRPGQATQRPVLPKGRTVSQSSSDSSTCRNSSEHDRHYRIEEEGSDITDVQRDCGRPGEPPASKEVADGDVDLEAQDLSQFEVQQARRRAILEENPELTEEITF